MRLATYESTHLLSLSMAVNLWMVSHDRLGARVEPNQPSPFVTEVCQCKRYLYLKASHLH